MIYQDEAPEKLFTYFSQKHIGSKLEELFHDLACFFEM